MYRGRLSRDLARWVDKGIIEPAQAEAIMKDYGEQPQTFSLGRVLSILAALLVGAAVLLLVASNWDAIPRLLRVSGMIALIWALHLGAAACLSRGQTALAPAMLVLGTITFGGAIALVGQMYHISGDQLSMVFVWFVMCCVSAAGFRAGSLTVFAAGLAWAYFSVFLGENDLHWAGWSPWLVPAMAAVVLALVYYTEAGRARHLVYLLLIGWLSWLYSLNQSLTGAVLFAACGFVAFLAVTLPWSPVIAFARRAGAAPPFYTFLFTAIGLFLIHAEVESGPRLIAIGLVTLAVAVAAISLCGRDNGAVRYLAYAVFAAEMLYLASVTIGSIIGTSGFFLMSGLLVALVAYLVIRIERRVLRSNAGEVRS